jgi:hypothetical protein
MGMAARAVLLGCLAAVVLGVAYVIVERGDSSPTLTPVVRTPPVVAKVGSPTVLGKGRASLASGGATGLWVTRQSTSGAPGRLMRFRLPTGAPDKPLPLDITPYAVAVGNGSVWVVGTGRHGSGAVLERIDPKTGKVKARTLLAAPPACVTHSFASCTPAVTSHGVWVPLADQIVHVTPSGTMADRTVPLDGNLWDMASDGRGSIWAIAELGLYRVDERTGRTHRWSIKPQLNGLQPGHIAVNDKALWISAFPRPGSSKAGRLIHVIPGKKPVIPQHQQRVFPGAGSLALVGGGLWLERYDGQGELDRLNQVTGDLSGPFVPVRDDVIQIVPRNGNLWILSYRPSGNKRTVTQVVLQTAPSG